MLGESRSAPGGGAMGVGEIERELARLRMNDDGTLGLRASVLNLIVVTDEESAPGVTQAVSNLAGRYPSRAIVLISDPEEAQTNLDVGVSAFCAVRGGTGGSQVCAELVTVHAEGPPALHLESLAGPLLVSDLPVFLWYPGHFSPSTPEFSTLLDDPENPAIGDLQWVALSPWRTLMAEMFGSAERAAALESVHKVEVLYGPGGESRALLLVGWLASSLGWRVRGATHDDGRGAGRKIHFLGPTGEVVVAMDPNSPDAKLRRIRLYSEGPSFQVSRHRALREARATVMQDDEIIAERTV